MLKELYYEFDELPDPKGDRDAADDEENQDELAELVKRLC